MKIEQNLLSKGLLAKLKLFSRDGKQPTRTNFFSYSSDIIGFSNAIFAFDLDDFLKNEVCNELIAKGIFEKEPTYWSAFIHLMSRNSGIPWHNDENYVYTGTIYLNEIWDANFGGYFAYENGDEIKCIVPTYNTGCFFVPPLRHSALMTSNNSPLRESVQIFVKEF